MKRRAAIAAARINSALMAVVAALSVRPSRLATNVLHLASRQHRSHLNHNVLTVIVLVVD